MTNDNYLTREELASRGTDRATRRTFLTTMITAGVSTIATNKAWASNRVGLTDPTTIFRNAAQYFNLGQWNDLAALLDPNVICYTVNVGSSIQCKNNVMNALRNIGGQRGANFTPEGPVSISAGNPFYIVTGCARWHDWDAPGPPDTLNYEFHVRNNLITYMWAPEGKCGGPTFAPIPQPFSCP